MAWLRALVRAGQVAVACSVGLGLDDAWINFV